ncbi:PTS mannitol transporter subunit IICB [Tuberibacillus sp. Marseille-P3662]|uniref:PTS mannitol transporter subunit IICB n=1 Tax=Tuberibacillus sp. Marseille-P3662 TaxID=1965358 RepID=UPI000A1CEB04|nr:PTS mannitol transporter subunit IICB [Tuberibacillus sp. Marseille-P3662]
MSQETATAGTNSGSNKGVKAKVQRFGSYLSGMVMPNIGAFIAWGLITALFIPSGWFPNEHLAELVDPMINYLLPLLIGYTGGKIIHDVRGGVVGALATIGVVAGADMPMLLGGMIMGPLGGYVIKKFDDAIEGKIKQGLEMLVNNFSAGILGGILTILGFLAIGPVIEGLSAILEQGVQLILDAGLLPLASIFIEPAKVLFLNNAINHGVLVPIAAEQAAETGKSILYLLEPNPGPGLGILLAFWFAGKGSAKSSAPGAAFIHLIGGVHEIYFPYVLMKPALILSVILGGVSGVFTFSLFDAGLTAVPSPGSIIALLLMTPKGNFIGVIVGVIVSAVVSFVVSSFILKRSKDDDNEEDLSEATKKMEEMKGKESSVGDTLKQESSEVTADHIDKIVFACDAGMGSSAMGASLLKDKVKKAGLSVEVTNTAINQLPNDADLVVTHQDLTERAKEKLPDAQHVSVENFLSSPKYDELMEQLKKDEE